MNTESKYSVIINICISLEPSNTLSKKIKKKINIFLVGNWPNSDLHIKFSLHAHCCLMFCFLKGFLKHLLANQSLIQHHIFEELFAYCIHNISPNREKT